MTDHTTEAEFLTDAQLCELLHVDARTTLRWRRDGGGPKYVRAGLRRVLYRRDDVLAWAAANSGAVQKISGMMRNIFI